MTLLKSEIIERLNPTYDSKKRIIVTPILDKEDQLGITGIDVRLGKQFIVFREHLKGIFTPKPDKLIEQPINMVKRYQEEIIIPIGKKIILHPGKLIIGSTLEYVSIPLDLECQVEGRSSWARLGLIVATATTVEPGYKGVITLELSNTGTIPIELYPGLKIGQLIFHQSSKMLNQDDVGKKKYAQAIGPGYSKIFRDKHLDYFVEIYRYNSIQLNLYFVI